MNRDRRRRLQNLRDAIEEIRVEEEEAFNNSPDSIQESERGQAIADNADRLESIVEDLDGVLQ